MYIIHNLCVNPLRYSTTSSSPSLFLSHPPQTQDVTAVFEDLEEMKQYVRRAGKFLPEKIDAVQYEGRTAAASKQLFIEFIRDTDRSRLAADVEIKVNNMNVVVVVTT